MYFNEDKNSCKTKTYTEDVEDIPVGLLNSTGLLNSILTWE